MRFFSVPLPGVVEGHARETNRARDRTRFGCLGPKFGSNLLHGSGLPTRGHETIKQRVALHDDYRPLGQIVDPAGHRRGKEAP